MEKLTAGQCLEFARTALSKSSSPEVVLLAYAVDSLVQEMLEMAGQLAEFAQDFKTLDGNLDQLQQRYSQLQYLAKARSRDA